MSILDLPKEYFIPDMEDIRVGYECELNTVLNPGWHKWKINKLQWESYEGNTIEDYLELERIRVPYLTKEDIESLGWEFVGESVDTWFKKEGIFKIGTWTSYKIVIHYGFYDKRLYINADDTGEEHKIFEGQCKDLNTLKYLEKLLGI